MKKLILALSLAAIVSCSGRDEPVTPPESEYTLVKSFDASLSHKVFRTGQNRATTIGFSNLGPDISVNLAGVNYRLLKAHYKTNAPGFHVQINGNWAVIKVEQSITHPASTVRKLITFIGFPSGSGSYEMLEN